MKDVYVISGFQIISFMVLCKWVLKTAQGTRTLHFNILLKKYILHLTSQESSFLSQQPFFFLLFLHSIII